MNLAPSEGIITIVMMRAILPRSTARSLAYLNLFVAFAALSVVGCKGSSATTPGDVVGYEGRANGIELTATHGKVRVTFLGEGTARVQVTDTDTFPSDTGWAVQLSALAASPPSFTLSVGADDFVLRTALMGIRITRSPLQIEQLDADDAVVAERAVPTRWQDGVLTLTRALPADEHVYGLGDRAGGLDHRGQFYVFWNYDAYGWNASYAELYKSIPFMLSMRDGKAHGLFIDNPGLSSIDIGASSSGELIYTAYAGTIDQYLFAGPTPKEVIANYTAVTGRTPLPPLWSLGYHQSRGCYLTESEVREVAERLRADAIPSDALWLDIEFEDGYRTFTYSSTAFPDFSTLATDLLDAGFRTVAIADPHIKVEGGYAAYESGLSGDHFIKDRSGAIAEYEVWPGLSAFPEFTLERTRTWWGQLFAAMVAEGYAGFWNDMNEPAVFDTESKTFAEDLPHRLDDDGGAASHLALHNVYGALNARATYEGVLALSPSARPFVLTRAAYAGAQRYAASWTGDNLANRDHLALSIRTLLNLGVSGYAFVGADVGGFGGITDDAGTLTDAPDAELLTEWMELGAYQPFYRNHSTSSTRRREPWVDGTAHEARRRTAIERRYRLLPYIYTAFEESSRTGLPVNRPLWLEYPSDSATYTNDRAFLLGRDLLVAPRLTADAGSFSITLPAESWYDTRTGALLDGGTVTVTPAADDSVVVFARAGAIIPRQPLVQSTSAPPSGALTLDVWPGADCAGALYLDDGTSFDYVAGVFRRIAYACVAGDHALSVTASTTEGSYATWWSSTDLILHGVGEPSAVTYTTTDASATATYSYDSTAQSATLALPSTASDWEVTVTW